jgi:hypothetical protein
MPLRYQITTVAFKAGNVKVYATPKVKAALDELMEEMTLYHGVRLTQVLEAVYEQGKKDGARAAFEALDERVAEAKNNVPHKLPGRPKLKRTLKKK